MPDRKEGDLGAREEPVDRDQQDHEHDAKGGIAHALSTIILSEIDNEIESAASILVTN